MAFGHWDAPPTGGASLASTLATMELFFLLVIFGTILCVFLLAGWLWKRGRVGQSMLALVVLGFCWPLYSAFYPSESFYRDELHRLAQVDLPQGVIFLEKETTFPDHFGDYSACFIVRLAPSAMDEFKSKLGAGVPVNELLSSCKPGASRLSKAEAIAFDLTPRATREDAVISVQLVPSESLAKVSWELW